jgi:hypothetical protein
MKLLCKRPITVAVRSKVRNVFARSNTGIVDSNPTRGTVLRMSFYSVPVVLCIERPCEWLIPVQGIPPSVSKFQISCRWEQGREPDQSNEELKIRTT